MRGARPPSWCATRHRRIIPADAGSTTGWRRRTAGRRDHPRGCGEHVSRAVVASRMAGSSPRMRGALPGPVGVGHSRRIIPADAGSTGPDTPRCTAGRDHPRGCGEHLPDTGSEGDYWGSSPRMRGAQVEVLTVLVAGRIIPADAGSTEWRHVHRYGHQDHPRGCGEHALVSCL